MDGYELFQLGRRLIKLASDAIPEVGLQLLPASTRAIVFDIFENPDSSISDITARVHFPQSQVSACVARLREAGVVETASDPRDRRRTLVRPTAASLQLAREKPSASIDAAVAEAIGSADPADVQRVVDALDALSELLPPPG
jgi:DNA-binding MarR family transcriptional regulator